MSEYGGSRRSSGGTRKSNKNSDAYTDSGPDAYHHHHHHSHRHEDQDWAREVERPRPPPPPPPPKPKQRWVVIQPKPKPPPPPPPKPQGARMVTINEWEEGSDGESVPQRKQFIAVHDMHDLPQVHMDKMIPLDNDGQVGSSSNSRKKRRHSDELSAFHKLLLEQNQFNQLLQKQTDVTNQLHMQTLNNQMQQREMSNQMQMSQLANQMGQQNLTNHLFSLATKSKSAPVIVPPPPPPPPPPCPPPPPNAPVVVQQQAAPGAACPANRDTTQTQKDVSVFTDGFPVMPLYRQYPLAYTDGMPLMAPYRHYPGLPLPRRRGFIRPHPLDPNLCPYCGSGVFRKRTTVTGYLTAIFCFPCGLYCCLEKKCCYVVECSYCRTIGTHDPVDWQAV